jgi:hypothetical protein
MFLNDMFQDLSADIKNEMKNIFMEKERTQNPEEIVDNNSSNNYSNSVITTDRQPQPALHGPPHAHLQNTSESSIIHTTGSTVDEITVDTTFTSPDNNNSDHEDKIDCTNEERVGDNSDCHGPLAMLRKGAVAAVGGTMVSIRNCHSFRKRFLPDHSHIGVVLHVFSRWALVLS